MLNIDDYDLDEDGYILVKFEPFIKDNIIKSNFSTSMIPSSHNKDFFIPPQYIEMAEKGTITKEILLGMEYADVLRLATHPKARDIVMNILGIRGVYLKNKYLDEEGAWKDVHIKPHQIKALTWMSDIENRDSGQNRGFKGGILSKKMGLGKTLTAIIHVLITPKQTFPSLIICSKTLMGMWKRDGIEKFFTKDVKVLYLHKEFLGTKGLAAITREHIVKYDIVITSYDVCIQACKQGNYDQDCFEMGDDHTLMKGKILSIHERTKVKADNPKLVGSHVIYGTPWHRVICDESQKFANPTTKTYKCIMAIYGNYKWCLTGTPIRNYNTDIWAQLRFCGYNGITQTIEWKRKGNKVFKEQGLINYIFSMDYKDANIKLPPKAEHIINIELTGEQKSVYDFVIGATRDVYDMMMQKLCSFSCVLAMFTRLRQCAIAPYLLTAESKREKAKGKLAKYDKEAVDLLLKMSKGGLGKWCYEKTGEAGIYSSKISKIIETLEKIPKDEKVIIFSMFTSCLDLLADAIDARLEDFGIIQIDGDTPFAERDTLLEKFKKDKSIRAGLFTYKVGSEGLNLTHATHVICIEPWWTPAVSNQAKARSWRIGQTKEVNVHNIIVSNSIEERIIEICNEKDVMASSYLEGTTQSVEKVGLDKATLGRILGIR